jgi:hypothetical protein
MPRPKKTQTEPEIPPDPTVEETQVSTPAPAAAFDINKPDFSSPAPPAAETAIAETFSLRDRVAQAGFDTSGIADDDQLASALIEGNKALLQARRELEEQRQLAESGRLYHQHEEDFQAWLKQKQAEEKQTPAAPEKPAFEWDAPEFDPNWLYQVDENGNLRPGADRSLPDKIAKWRDWSLRTQTEFLRNPKSLIERAMQDSLASIREELRKEYEQKLEERFSKTQQEQKVMDYMALNEDKLLQKDKDGTYILDANRQPALTQRGQAMLQYLKETANDGRPNEVRLRDAERYADSAAYAELLAKQNQPPDANGKPAASLPQRNGAQPAPQQRRQRFLDRLPAKQGTIPDDPTARVVNPEADFRARNKKFLETRGIT